MCSKPMIGKVKLRPISRSGGGVKTTSESGPTVTVKVPGVIVPPLEVKSAVKVVGPWSTWAKLSTGSTVKSQLSPVCETATLLVSTPLRLEQVTVYAASSVM